MVKLINILKEITIRPEVVKPEQLEDLILLHYMTGNEEYNNKNVWRIYKKYIPNNGLIGYFPRRTLKRLQKLPLPVLAKFYHELKQVPIYGR